MMFQSSWSQSKWPMSHFWRIFCSEEIWVALLGKFYGGRLFGKASIRWQKNPAASPLFAHSEPFCRWESTIILATFVSSSGRLLKSGFSGIFTCSHVVSRPSNSPGSIWFISIPFPLLVRLDNSNRISPFCEFVLIDATRIRYFVRNFAKIFPDWGQGEGVSIPTGMILYSPLSFSYKDPLQTQTTLFLFLNI